MMLLAAVRERKEIRRRITNVRLYDAELMRNEWVPTGDDYNEIIRLLDGGSYRPPSREGRN
jgi:hypothetical protein